MRFQNPLQTTKSRIIAGVTALAALVGGSMMVEEFDHDSITECVSQEVGTHVRGTMEVREAKYFGPRIGLLLNSVSYRDAVADGDTSEMYTLRVLGEKSPNKFEGKTVSFEGTVEEYNGKRQILVSHIK